MFNHEKSFERSHEQKVSMQDNQVSSTHEFWNVLLVLLWFFLSSYNFCTIYTVPESQLKVSHFIYLPALLHTFLALVTSLWEFRYLDGFQTLNKRWKCDQVSTCVKNKCNQSESFQMASMWIFSQIKGFWFFYKSLKHKMKIFILGHVVSTFPKMSKVELLVIDENLHRNTYLGGRSNQIDIFFKKKKKKELFRLQPLSSQHFRN